MILSNPDSEFIPLEAHTISVLSGHTYFLASEACLIAFVALFLLLNLAFEHGVCAMDRFARHGEGMVFLGLGRGVLVVVAFFVLFRWERRMKTGPDRIKSGGKHIRVVKIGNGRVYIKIRLYCTKTV
jgi:hypothetical protein